MHTLARKNAQLMNGHPNNGDVIHHNAPHENDRTVLLNTVSFNIKLSVNLAHTRPPLSQAWHILKSALQETPPQIYLQSRPHIVLL